MLMADRYIQETELPAPNEACLEDIFLPLNYKPTREDVICSRGSISYHHAANIRLRELIEDCLEEYQRSKSKVERSALVSNIIETIQGEKGRFIRQDPKTKRWFQVRSRTTREKVGQAIRAALKKREQHDSQFAQANKQHRGSHNSLPEAKAEPNAAGGILPPDSPLHKLHASSPQISPFSPSLSHTRVAKLRHDIHTGNQDLQYFDTVPLPGSTTVPPPNLFSTTRQSLYTGTSSLHDFGYGNSEASRNTGNLGFGRSADGFVAGPDHGMNESLFDARQDVNRSLQLGSAGFLPRSDLGARPDAYSFLELDQRSRGFSKLEGQQQQQLESSGQAIAAVAQTGGSTWHQQGSSIFPEMTAAMFGGTSSPGLHNGHFPSIADAHQIVSQRLSPAASTGSLHGTNPSATAASMPLSIRDEEAKSTPPPGVREDLDEN